MNIRPSEYDRSTLVVTDANGTILGVFIGPMAREYAELFVKVMEGSTE